MEKPLKFGVLSRLWIGFAGALVVLAGTVGDVTPRASAQLETGEAGEGGREPAAAARAVAQKSVVRPGDTIAIAVVLKHGKGFHSWPNKPVIPKELGGDFTAIPTTIEVPGLPAGARVVGIQWPPPRAVKVNFTGAPIDLMSYPGQMVAYVAVALDPTIKPGPAAFQIKLSHQACNDSTCLQPETFDLSVTVEVAAPGEPRGAPTLNEPDLFKDLKPSGAAPVDASSPVPTMRPSLFLFELPDPSGPIGMLVLFLVSALAGAVMNLTPCVLPIIPIKVMTLTQHAGSPGRAVILGLWMALGVVCFWVVIGLPMAFVSFSLDPSRLIFGTWWVTLSLGVIIVAMGLGIMGLFSIQLPQSAYLVNLKADTPWGSFVFGIMAAVLGLPCFGFVVGGLLAGAATLPAVAIMIVFTGLGVGMGAPYLVLAAKPGLVEKIPRTGPASELVKQMMGLLLLAAAAFFVGAGLKTLVHEKPYLSETLGWWAVAFFITIAALWLTLRTFQVTKATWPKVVMPALAALAVAGIVAFANDWTNVAREDYLRRRATTSDTLVPGAWNSYTPERFKKAAESGKVIVADFTADWCIICKSLKRGVLDRDPVHAELAKDDVIPFEVDCSSNSAPGWKFLNELGQTGVPTLAIFGPGLERPIIFNAYTPSMVVGALAKARSGIAAAPEGQLR